MKKVMLFVVGFIFWLALAAPAVASDPVADASASLYTDYQKIKVDSRAKRVQNFLAKYNSPLAPYSQMIVKLADQYSIDYRLVVAIAGVESTFCKSIPYNSYNCWGWKNGKHAFESFPNALENVSKTLSLHYYNRGFDTPETIGPIYAPPSSTWAGNVRFFMNLMQDYTTTTFLAQQFSI